MVGWLILLNHKGSEAKRPWANFGYHLGMCLKRMKEITQHFSDVNRCHTVDLNCAHAEYRSETLRLDATFLAMGLCNTKWILETYGAVVTWIHGTCLSFQLLDFVSMDMNFQIPKRKCN